MEVRICLHLPVNDMYYIQWVGEKKPYKNMAVTTTHIYACRNGDLCMPFRYIKPMNT